MNTESRAIIEERINDLAAKNDGRITATEVLEDAKDEDSPLHEFFTWDDTIAAEKFRLMQARQLIRSVRIVHRIDHKRVTTVAYVRDPEMDSTMQGYISVDKVRKSEDLSRDTLLAEFKRASAALNRAKKLATLFGLSEDIDNFLRDLEMTRAKLAPPPDQLHS